MNAKHTPGPWVHYDDTTPAGKTGRHEVCATGRTVAHIYHDDAQGKADASLITAAPDLLDALREIIEPMEPDCGAPDCPDCEPWRKARAAIAKTKAEGL